MKIAFNADRVKFLILSSLFFLACVSPYNVSAQEEDMQKVTNALDAKTKAMENKAVAMLYVDAAQRSDINQMLSLTSPITRKMVGDNKIRQIYVKLHVPIFSESKPDLDLCHQEQINDPNGTTGSLFSCILNTKDLGKIVTIITVLNEGFSYVSEVKFAQDSDNRQP